MAITINKTKAVAQVTEAAAAASKLAYLPDNLANEVAQLPADVLAVFEAATELTPDLIEQVAANLPESLLDGLITAMEEYLAQSVPANPAPAPAVVAQVTPAPDADRKARRDALKAEIAANAKGATITAKQVETTIVPPAVTADAPTADKKTQQPVVQPPAANFSVWDNLFPVGQQVTVINRGGGKFELHIGKVAPVAQPQPVADIKASAKPEKKPKMSSIYDYIVSDDYLTWLASIKETYPTLEDRIAYAESVGLKRGGDPGWTNVTKEGNPLPPAIENMYLLGVLQKHLGVEQYVEGARTPEERKALLNGTAPWPATAKPRK